MDWGNMTVSSYLLIGYIAWNIVAFAIMGLDKVKAVTNRWRIPEKRLLGIALAMGALGILAGMYVFRHKTKHAKFTVGVPICLGVNILTVVGLSLI